MNTPILNLIRQQSCNNLLTFKEFMEIALYGKNLGYYVNDRPKIGFKHDFITAPSIGSLFARCLSEQIKQIFKELPENNFIEYGAGYGHLAATLGSLIDFNKYIIIEISPQLRKKQHEYIATHNPDLLNKVVWLDDVPNNFIGIIFANEVMDAFPVHKFYFNDNKLQEFYISINEHNKLNWKLGEPSIELKKAFAAQNLSEILANSPDYVSEINTSINPWLKNIAQRLNKGVILLCDYGFDRQEYFHPMRNMGTLMTHRLQRTSSDVLANPGEEDITAHIDFTTVAETTLETNLSLLGYTNLANFLVNCGVLTHYQTTNKLDEFNLLTSPSEMGELFKVIALGCQMDYLMLDGFKSLDYSHKL